MPAEGLFLFSDFCRSTFLPKSDIIHLVEIKIVRGRISKQELIDLAEAGFGDMVKGVVDIERHILALGGELHADAETILLEDGSQQKDLWGFNLYPEEPKEGRIEFSSFINIRPSQGNRSMEVKDPLLRKNLKEIIDELVE